MGRKWLLLSVGLMILLAAAPGSAKEGVKKPTKMEAEDVFGIGRLWTVHLRITEDGLRMMDPTRPVPRRGGVVGRSSGQPATAPATRPGEPATKPAAVEGQRLAPSPFGFEYAYVKCIVELENEVYRDVGIRYKGNASYQIASRGLKRPLKLDFNRFVDGQKFHGLTALNLNNNAYDPSMLREAMSYAVYRDAGVPAPRTAFAMVYLTVDGKYDREYLGVYAIVEEIDNSFLKSRFGSAKGLLLKPERISRLPYLGEKWSDYEDKLRPKTDVTEAAARRIVEFVKLINQADDETFRRDIASYMNVDGFLRYIAASTMLLNLDSFLVTGHNYYMYLNPEDNKIHWMPWDLHLSFGSFGEVESAEGKADLSIMRMYQGENKLVDRLLAMDDVNKAYKAHVKQFVETCCSVDKMHARIDVMQAAVSKADALAKAAGKKEIPATMPVNAGRIVRQKPDLKPFVSQRVESVLAQLDGKTEGFVPGGDAGSRWRFAEAFTGRGGRAGATGLGLAFMRASDTGQDRKLSQAELDQATRRFFADSDKDGKGSLDEKTLLAALQRSIPKSVEAGAGITRPDAPQRPKNMINIQNLGLEQAVAKLIIKEADANKDRRITLDELLATARKTFKQADRGSNGLLDERQVAETMIRLLPAPTTPPPARGW